MDSSQNTSFTNQSSKRILVISMLFLLLSLVVVGLATWFFLTKVKPAYDPVVKLKHALETITKQEVRQEGHSLELRTDRIQELAVIEREMRSIIKYETTFLGSKKTIILKGKFTAKAGFDLSQAGKFSLIEGQIIGSPPPARILSVELKDYEIYHSQDGTFNKLQPADQEAATRQLLAQARKDAEESDLRDQAELQFRQRIDDLMESPAL